MKQQTTKHMYNRLKTSQHVHRVMTLQTEKKPTFSNFLDEIAGNMSTDAYLLLLFQILSEHRTWKMNYSTNSVKASYFVKLPQSNFSDYKNSLIFPRVGASSLN